MSDTAGVPKRTILAVTYANERVWLHEELALRLEQDWPQLQNHVSADMVQAIAAVCSKMVVDEIERKDFEIAPCGSAAKAQAWDEHMGIAEFLLSKGYDDHPFERGVKAARQDWLMQMRDLYEKHKDT